MLSEQMMDLRKVALALVIIVVVLLVGVAVFVSQRFNQVVKDTVLVTCVYQVNVLAFEDSNGNGAPEAGEIGVSGVQVTLEHSQPTADSTPEVSMTDADGKATINADKSCKRGDTFTVKILPTSGYSATTPVVFGPYPVPELTSESAAQTTQQPIPDVIYVGLKQG